MPFIKGEFMLYSKLFLRLQAGPRSDDILFFSTLIINAIIHNLITFYIF